MTAELNSRVTWDASGFHSVMRPRKEAGMSEYVTTDDANKHELLLDFLRNPYGLPLKKAPAPESPQDDPNTQESGQGGSDNAGMSKCPICQREWLVIPSDDCLMPSCGCFGSDSSRENFNRPCQACGIAHWETCNKRVARKSITCDGGWSVSPAKNGINAPSATGGLERTGHTAPKPITCDEAWRSKVDWDEPSY
jgi:hypothetical protein